MKIRIISAAVAIAIVIPILIFSKTIALPIAIAIVSVISVFEMLRCCGVHKRVLFVVPYYMAALLFPTLIHLRAWYGLDVPITAVTLLSVFFLLVWAYPAAIFSKGKLSVTDASTAAIGSMYVLAGLNSILYIRQILHVGGYVFALILIGAWVTDTAAYFCGRAFGRHKLIPEVSPKKTVEGSIGGILCCILCFAIYGLIADHLMEGGVIEVNYPALLITAFFISIVSQIGDLAMSLLKRHYGIKDFGKIMPGHGGLMDRFDSMIAIAIILLICYSVSYELFGVSLFMKVV